MERLDARARVARFRKRFGLSIPILEAPMAGANSLARAGAIHRYAAFLVMLFCILFGPSVAENGRAEEYGPGKAFPFTEEDDQDGARYVWFITCASGFRYDYITAREFPTSRRFRQVDDPRGGDIAWWPTYVAIYKAGTSEYLTAKGFYRPEDLKPSFSAPKYYRLQLFVGEKFAERSATRWRMCIPNH